MTDARKHLYGYKAKVIQALGDPVRLAIVDLLSDGEVCVCDIAKRVGAERSNVSRHLAVLLKSGIVSTRRQGLNIYYELRCPCIHKFLSCVTDILKQQADHHRSILKGLR